MIINCVVCSKRAILLFCILIGVNMTSCIVTYDARTTQIEIMKPAIISIPENIKTVALINGISKSRFSQPFTYNNLSYTTKTDTTIKYRDLSNTCIDALAMELKKEGYFSNVMNFRDSFNIINPSNKRVFDPEKLFEETKSDLCIFLNDLNFDILEARNFETSANFASLSWTMVYKKDTLSYTYKQGDTLSFAPTDFPADLAENMKIKIAANNSSIFMGQSFCAKIIPTWTPVERMYYTTDNKDMREAEKFALNSDWLKAAEIWNKQTKSQNLLTVAEATYNMALACEMEGKLDAAIDWLVRSSTILQKRNEIHKMNCQQYIALLTQRKKEIEKLSHQVRN
jgi:hypothetical protein